MSPVSRSVRIVALSILFAGTLLTAGASGLVAARPLAPVIQQAATPTPMDSSAPAKLDMGKPFTTDFDNSERMYAYFSFKGKANQVVSVTVSKASGNYGLGIRVLSQNDVELASIYSGYMQMLTLQVKLPQDGNYLLNIQQNAPGTGDFEPGSISVTVDDAAATPAAPATKASS